MKKYTSVIVFILFGTLLWQYANHPRAISQDVHHAIQSKIAELITNDIQKKHPQASKFQIEKLTSSEINDNKVKASFAFTFIDPASNSEVRQTGEAIFHREPSDQIGKSLWRMQSHDLTQSEVVFNEDEVVTPEKGSNSNSASEAKCESVINQSNGSSVNNCTQALEQDGQPTVHQSEKPAEASPKHESP